MVTCGRHPRTAQCFVAIGIAAVSLSAVHARAADAPDKPQRIVSLNMCTDELALRLADRSTIASITWLSRDPDNSNVAQLAQDIPVNHGMAEEIIAFKPDLVLAGTYTARAAASLMQRAGVRVVDVDVPKTFADVRQQYRDIAAILGAPERGERIVADMDERLAGLEKDRPPTKPTAILLNPNGYTVGRGSLTDEVLTRAGLDNMAERLGIGAYGELPLETVVMNPVDVLIVSASRDGPPAMATELLRHPALADLSGRTRIVTMPSRLWNCGGPALVEAVERLMHVAKEVRGKVAHE